MIENPIDVSSDIVDMILLTSQYLSRPLELCFKSSLTPLQVYTLFKIYIDGPQTMTELADSLSISKQQMTKIIGRLAQEGYVERHHDKDDHRIIISRISDETLEYIKARHENFSEYIAGIFDRLDSEDARAFIESIANVNRIMHKFSQI